MAPQTALNPKKKPIILHKNPYDPQPPASPEEIVVVDGSQYARRPILVAYDYDCGWIVEVPILHQNTHAGNVLRVEYEFAHHHFRGISHPGTKKMAVEIGQEIAAKIGGGIVITGKPKVGKSLTTRLSWDTPKAGENFSEYAKRLWGSDWAIARKTRKNQSFYARCLTPKEYQTARMRWELAQIKS